jgi:hypothetical protein
MSQGQYWTTPAIVRPQPGWGREVGDSFAGLNAGISVGRRVDERGEIASEGISDQLS